MKKLIITALSLLLVTACSAPPTNREVAGSNANMAADSKSAPALTEADAIAKEKQIWDALQKKDIDGFANSLDANSIYVASEEIYDKAGIIKGVTGFVPGDLTLSDWRFVPLDKDAGVVTYKVTFKGTADGGAATTQSLYATSAWAYRGGKWVTFYHQDTEIQAPPPADKTEKAAPSPAATSAPVVTTSDAEANEKAVWDTFRTRNYSGFESVLAPEFIEVEANGVITRAESAKAVQNIDLTKATLSDWKTIKINDNATLVTYTAKLPGFKPDTERHTTIWANRNGKWLGVFHHGTPVLPPPPPQPTASKK